MPGLRNFGKRTRMSQTVTELECSGGERKTESGSEKGPLVH